MEATSNTSILIADRNIAERRLVSIARAIDVNKNQHRRKPNPTRAEDLNLYRRAREILGADRI